MRPIASILLLFIYHVALSQNEDMYFTHYQTEDGLPSREVYCITQDKEGYIWFGTDNGISRFDGYEFKNFQIPNNFEANVVNSIILKQNKLWFGSMFFGAYYLSNGHLVPFAYNHLLSKYKGKYLTSILEYISDDGDFYFSLFNYGIIKIDKTGVLTEYKIMDQIGFICINADGKIIGTRSTAPNFVHNAKPHKKVILQYIGEKKYTIDLKIDDAVYTKFFQNQSLKDDSYFFYYNQLSMVRNGTLDVLPFDNKINSFLRDSLDKIYLGLGDYGGMAIANSVADLKKGNIKTYLKNNAVSSVYIDNLQNLWVTTINNGVFYCKSPSQKVFVTPESSNEIFVSSVEAINDDECYFGTSNGDVFNVKNGSIKRLPDFGDKKYICDELVYNKYNQKLYSYGGYYKNDQWHELIFNKSKRVTILKNFSLDTLNNRIWLANYLQFGYFDANDNYKTFLGVDNEDFIRIFDLLYQHDTLWLATQNGLYASHEGSHPCIQILNKKIE